jgi:hypothetical protein
LNQIELTSVGAAAVIHKLACFALALAVDV